MKRIFTILIVACVAMLFTSCQKEGVYNPSKKISKVTYTDQYGNKTIQVWTWNKNNTLDKIDFYEDGSLDYTFHFTYDKKRLVRMDDYDYEQHVEYKYDKNGLKEAYSYDGNTVIDAYTFTHQNGKITQIIDNYNSSKNISGKMVVNPLQFIFPDELYTVTENAKKKACYDNSKASCTYTFELTWDKDNISQIVETRSTSSYTYTYNFEYDKYNNPFYGSLNNFYVETNFTNGHFSKNNITKLEENILNENGTGITNLYNYQYTYDGKWPVSKKRVRDNYFTLSEFEYTK